jgi:hypothetical protein
VEDTGFNPLRKKSEEDYNSVEFPSAQETRVTQQEFKI